MFNSGHVLMPSNCIRLDNGNSLLTGVQPKELYTSGDEVTPKVDVFVCLFFFFF